MTKQKKKFDWDNFKNSPKRICVHVRTPKEAKQFRKLMHEHGLKWCNGDDYTNVTDENKMGGWNDYKENTAYDNKGQYGSLHYSNKMGNEILMFSSYDFS